MNLVFKKQFFLWTGLLILSSCTKKSLVSDQLKLNVKIQAARLADVPMPFGAQPFLAYISDTSFGYHIKDQIDLVQYYLLELEQNGWRLIGQFDGPEQNLVFEKPHKLLSIIIRQQKDQFLVLILTKNK